MLQQLALAAIIFQATTISQASGHGNIIVPKLTGDSDHEYYVGSPAGIIKMDELVGDKTYGEFYLGVDDWFTKNKIASLKQYITTYGTDIDKCGSTDMAGTPQPVPSDGYAQHDTLGTSHPGPCEIWCDDTRVFHDTNCAGKFAGQVPTKIPIDVSVCQASSEFIFYWLALHVKPWQVYINCALLDGKKAASSGSTNSTSPATTTTAPVAAPTEANIAMLKQVALVAALVTQAANLPTVFGHGNIIVPPPTGDSDHVYYFGGPAGTIDMPKIIGDASYGDYYEAVDEWFTKNGISSLKEYITTYGTNISECGNTLKDGTAEAIPSDGYAEHDTLGNSHPGPCEIWCDDTRVFNNTNCVTEFSGQSPAKIPIDTSKAGSPASILH
ncbi:hypothetical protein G195_011537 [Phytophthora kernoviae 00238/432]|uniref:N-acetylmuramoyl-L-alanine amidase domain-containing protein n=3 Tax=Phytophthora kernoviae TaxID=325452 RepID=A0A8T0M0G6_9STRA|nr:hypothetical protein G195_011537 [Phytophthora kernoviae 00238/432]KAG2525451.1 hypothetical protein JM16_004417 [Phytophthora kernoviae]